MSISRNFQRARSERGRRGEEAASRWYRERGWVEIARNWRCREGEIDLVCERGGVVAVIEVKARSGTSFGTPAEAVTEKKAARLRVLAGLFLAEHPGTRPSTIRFDVAEVYLPEGRVEVIEAAF